MIQSLKPLAQAALNVGRFVTGPRTATTADMARIRRAMGEQVLAIDAVPCPAAVT